MLKEISDILNRIPEAKLDAFADILFNHCTHRIYIIGNGGSSATASHFVGDLSALGYDAICLSDNVPRLTAITNDYGWEDVYKRQMQHIKEDDILIAISVHGGSDDWSNNLAQATDFALKSGAKVLSLTGFDGGFLARNSDLDITVPAQDTYIVEGIHSILTHVIWKKLEDLHK